MLNLSPVAAVPYSYCYGDRERGERSAGEIPQHGRCSIKKARSLHHSFAHTALIFAPSLHLMLQTKGYTEKLLKNSEMSFQKMCQTIPDCFWMLYGLVCITQRCNQERRSQSVSFSFSAFSCDVYIFFFFNNGVTTIFIYCYKNTFM